MSQGKPTVFPCSGFSAETDAQLLRKAMKGLGTDEDTIIKIIPKRSNEQRQEIKKYFKSVLGRDLDKDLKSELSANFERAIIALMTPPVEYDARELYKSMKGIGTDDDALVELLCSRTPQEIRAINAIYEQVNKSTLDKDIRGDCSGDYKKLMVALATGSRQEGYHEDKKQAEQDAHKLYNAGVARSGTNEETFISIIATQSYVQLRCLISEYRAISGHSLEEDIKSEMSGNIKKGLLSILKIADLGRRQYFAEKLHKAMVGAGTDDKALIRILVYCSERDLGDIKQLYSKAYGKTLASAVSGETSGHYKRTLIGIIGGA